MSESSSVVLCASESLHFSCVAGGSGESMLYCAVQRDYRLQVVCDCGRDSRCRWFAFAYFQLRHERQMQIRKRKGCLRRVTQCLNTNARERGEGSECCVLYSVRWKTSSRFPRETFKLLLIDEKDDVESR